MVDLRSTIQRAGLPEVTRVPISFLGLMILPKTVMTIIGKHGLLLMAATTVLVEVTLSAVNLGPPGVDRFRVPGTDTLVETPRDALRWAAAHTNILRRSTIVKFMMVFVIERLVAKAVWEKIKNLYLNEVSDESRLRAYRFATEVMIYGMVALPLHFYWVYQDQGPETYIHSIIILHLFLSLTFFSYGKN